MSVRRAQSAFPKLCQQGKQILITERDKPVSMLLPIGDYEAIMETMDLLSNSKAMKALRAARGGKLTYRKLSLHNEHFGL